MTALALAMKAEIVLGVLLVVRHRTVRLAGVLVLIVIGLGMIGAADPGEVRYRRTVFVIAGSLAAVCGSRLLSPGAALAAVRRVAGPWWLAPAGRLTGAGLVVASVVAVATIALAGRGADVASASRVGVVAGCYAVALGSLAMALAPLTGATAAGTLGLLAAWLGVIPPSALAVMLRDWPYVRRPAVLLWNVLPLDWRATRWFRAGTLEDPALFGVWVALGIVVAAWASARVYRGERPHHGEET